MLMHKQATMACIKLQVLKNIARKLIILAVNLYLCPLLKLSNDRTRCRKTGVCRSALIIMYHACHRQADPINPQVFPGLCPRPFLNNNNHQ